MREVKNSLTYIDDPSQYSCTVWNYQPSHSMLLIRLLRGVLPGGHVSYLIFGAVNYFEGPLSWMGADYIIGDEQELKQILLELDWIDNNEETLKTTTRRSKLYKFPFKSIEVRIIAGILYESKEIPKGFS